MSAQEALAYIYAHEILRFHQRALGRKRWKIVWSNRANKNRLGTCWYNRRSITVFWSTISKHSDPIAQVRSTMLHEIAHAMTPWHHHDNAWKWAFASIGGKPTRTKFTALQSTPALSSAPKTQ